MQLTVLVDNNTFIDKYYYGEPGLCYYIEDGDARILFDTGYSDVAVKNASAMNIDLSKVNNIIFSHGHNDHTRGLVYMAQKLDSSKIRIIAHPECLVPKFYEGTSIGMPDAAVDFARKCQMHLTSDPYWITDKLLFLGQIPRVHDFEQRSIGVRYSADSMEADSVLDDSALVYNGNNGLFVITGCSHSGICNIVAYAQKLCGGRHVAGIIGGMHLFKNNEELAATVDYLTKQNIDLVYPAHCVSLKAKIVMADRLPVHEVGVGLQLNIE